MGNSHIEGNPWKTWAIRGLILGSTILGPTICAQTDLVEEVIHSSSTKSVRERLSDFEQQFTRNEPVQSRELMRTMADVIWSGESFGDPIGHVSLNMAYYDRSGNLKTTAGVFNVRLFAEYADAKLNLFESTDVNINDLLSGLDIETYKLLGEEEYNQIRKEKIQNLYEGLVTAIEDPERIQTFTLLGLEDSFAIDAATMSEITGYEMEDNFDCASVVKFAFNRRMNNRINVMTYQRSIECWARPENGLNSMEDYVGYGKLGQQYAWWFETWEFPDGVISPSSLITATHNAFEQQGVPGYSSAEQYRLLREIQKLQREIEHE